MARLKGFEKLTPVEDALQTFFEKIKLEKMEAVSVPIQSALNRVTMENIIAENDLPHFDRSAVDGYSVKAKDTFGASQFKPRTLQLSESEEISSNETKPIWTGNPLPKGADAVVMLEHTKRLDGEVEVWLPVTPGENVLKRGEDVRRGEVAVKAGTRLKPHHLGLLAALGLADVNVVKKPKVAVLSTGNELVELGHKPEWNQVVDVNRLILSSMCHELGAEPVDIGIAKDDQNEIGRKIREAIDKAEVLITTGGTSVGHSDLVPKVINEIGSPGIIVHGIAMRPGMPTALATVDNKPVVVLPGNPVAAMFGFEVFVRPLILRLLGIATEPRLILSAKLTRRVSSALGRKVFLRVYAYQKDGEFFAEPVRVKGSGVLSTMTKANGYVVIPENREGLEEGEVVNVHLFDDMGGVKCSENCFQ